MVKIPVTTTVKAQKATRIIDSNRLIFKWFSPDPSDEPLIMEPGIRSLFSFWRIIGIPPQLKGFRQKQEPFSFILIGFQAMPLADSSFPHFSAQAEHWF